MPRIAIVEDNRDIAQMLRMLLEDGEHEFQCFEDGMQFFSVFERGEFDLILLDIALPLMNGYEILERLRQQDPELPVIAITAHASVTDEEKAFQAGFCAYFRKPILMNEEIFRAKVFEHLRTNKARTSNA